MRARVVSGREREEDRGPPVELALDPNTALVALDDPMHDREAHTGPFELVAGMESLKHTEEVSGVPGIEADAVVPDVIDSFPVRLLMPYLDDRHGFRSRELDGVG